MSNLNGYSDSQESALLEESVYNELQQEIGIDFLENSKMPEEKYNIPCEYTSYNSVSIQDPQPPVREEFSGIYNFELITPLPNGSKCYVYSTLLKKVFIDINQVLPLSFKWKPIVAGLLIRASMVFSMDEARSSPVVLCHNHRAMANEKSQSPEGRFVNHVVRCTNVMSFYEERNDHLSVVTPLGVPQVGSEFVTMYYKFMCKNSCTSGMNRRQTDLIFTLETTDGEVLGRQRLAVRVCSCPKRDKHKEECDFRGPAAKKRKLAVPPGKKLVSSLNDTQVYMVSIPVVGKENYNAILKYSYDLMAGNILRTNDVNLYKPTLDAIQSSML
ncbi:cellular tumor antigen p53 [Prorops nasuta]|uniref:cellular tumor antigen p53 n=1 Tax=Prorops nasuta TaxID=863751 RepID=UPI0034CE5952